MVQKFFSLFFILAIIFSEFGFSEESHASLTESELFQVESIEKQIEELLKVLHKENVTGDEVIKAAITHLNGSLSLSIRFFTRVNKSALHPSDLLRIENLYAVIKNGIDETMNLLISSGLDLKDQRYEFFFQTLKDNTVKFYAESEVSNTVKEFLNKAGIPLPENCFLATLLSNHS